MESIHELTYAQTPDAKYPVQGHIILLNTKGVVDYPLLIRCLGAGGEREWILEVLSIASLGHLFA